MQRAHDPMEDRVGASKGRQAHVDESVHAYIAQSYLQLHMSSDKRRRQPQRL